MITKAAFIALCPGLKDMTPVAAEQTYAQMLITGRIVEVKHPQTGAITIDPTYLAREAARARANTARADGTITT